MNRNRRKSKSRALRKKLVNRNYKDSLFRMIFGNRKAALELYNAINHSNYQNPEQLEITTIEGAIYMGVKNDLSFLIDSVMNLYEAQSTRNPNMPLRGLIYFARVYQGYVEKRELDIYSGSRIKIPLPQYIVFYNGSQEEPDRREYRLSDAFERKQDSYCLECVATVLNINTGHNRQLMENCSLLWQYAFFVSKVRLYLERYPENLEGAVDMAVEECIEEDILADFLKKQRGEVKDVILTEYNAERHIKNEKKLSYEEGVKEGMEQGLEQGIKAFIAEKEEENADKNIIIEKMQRHFLLDKDRAEHYYKRFTNKI
ncbi:hypothetical protein LIR51_14800 [Blautia producta]|uniref:hypothetical protein n=1 Tax=Blautia producta TaxID=33035 RepID=UPI001D009E8F|nr:MULTISPECIES: hypothetical protein [Blautia]MCB5876083.1 hypothetical protein [Blautia producta]MCB6783052.1 hypothetical protein [Blautia producta]MDT4376617.1 hypothetical protein [Blautia coccoides]